MFLVLLALALATGCRTVRLTSSSETSTTDSVEIRETIRDTIITVKADNSLVRALLECDSLGQVRMKELLEYRAGYRLKPPNVAIDNNVLTASAQVDSMSIYLQLKDRFEKHTSAQAQRNKETVTVEVNRLTWLQKLWIKLGQGLSGVFVASALLKLFKPNILTLWQKITKK